MMQYKRIQYNAMHKFVRVLDKYVCLTDINTFCMHSSVHSVRAIFHWNVAQWRLCYGINGVIQAPCVAIMREYLTLIANQSSHHDLMTDIVASGPPILLVNSSFLWRVKHPTFEYQTECITCISTDQWFF